MVAPPCDLEPGTLRRRGASGADVRDCGDCLACSMNGIDGEISSQPELWLMAAKRAVEMEDVLPRHGRRLAVVGCGTSYHIGRAFAVARELGRHGETDFFAASEFAFGRKYDVVLAISRSGTTTEVLRVLERTPPGVDSIAISAVAGTPVVRAAGGAVLLPEADEESIVQTRFATTSLAVLRAHLGEDLSTVVRDGRHTAAAAPPVDPTAHSHYVFLGQHWTVGLAYEAALKVQEMANVWAEAHAASEYRHGPISVAGPGTVVWVLGKIDPDVASAVAATGATFVYRHVDPMAELIAIQRLAARLARARGLDPGHPKYLSRSIR
jgi:fructoselysine-6-P-deglycase FrlB-like protein